MAINVQFVGWFKFFYRIASAAVNLIGNPGKEFKIEKEVRQKCPLAPYFFLIVEGVRTHFIKKAEAEEKNSRNYTPGW